MIPGGPDKPLQILLPEKAELQPGVIFLINCSDADLLLSCAGYFLMEAVTESIVFWDNEEKPRASASTNRINSTDWCIPWCLVMLLELLLFVVVLVLPHP